MKRTRVYILIIIVLISLILSNGCNKYMSKPPGDQYVRYHIPDKVITLDSTHIMTQAEAQLINAVAEGFVRLQPDGTLEKAMAKDWEISDDGKNYSFYLKDAKWADGDNVTAQDFEYAWNRILEEKTYSSFQYLFNNVKSMRAIDEKTFVVELKDTDAGFINKLVHPIFYPYHEDILVNGNGPFKVTYFDDEKYELEKNTNYWDEKNVSLKRMTWYINDMEKAWQSYKKNELDVITSIPQDIINKNLDKEWLKTNPLLANYYYVFNAARDVLEDERVRKALSYSLDRLQLVQKTLQGGQNPAKGFIPQGMPIGQTNEYFEDLREIEVISGNIEEARRLLAEAGYPEGEGFPKLQVLLPNREGNEFFAEAVVEQWKKNLNIDMEIKVLEIEMMRSFVEKRNFDIALIGWRADYPDAMEFLEHYLSFSGSNYSGWRNSEFDKYIKNAKLAVSQEEYVDYQIKAENILLKEMPLLPLFDYTRVYGAKEYVQGLFLPPVGAVVEFKWAYVE